MANLIVGNDNANTLTGTSGKDVIYGFDPNGSQKTATTIEATRVATGLNQPVFAGAPKGDTSRLFIVEKEGVIKILDTNTHQVLATPFLDIQNEVNADGERGLLGLAFDPDFANNGLFYVDMINNARRHRDPPLSRLRQSERRRRSQHDEGADHRSAGLHQSQRRLDRFRPGRRSLYRYRRRRQRRRSG